MKTILSSIALLVLASNLLACSYPTKARTVRVGELGSPESTRIYHFMQDRNGNEETTHDWLMDEATIETLAADHVCFDLTIRSRPGIDLHPSQWAVNLNGVAAEVTQREDPTRDSWSYTVRTMETTYERTTRRGTTRIEEPVEYERTTGYTQRRARACASLHARPAKLVLEVVLPQPRSSANWGQKFEWRLI